ncbi:hypothetical protein M404DRAFT_850438 [Pisolithus tinctorius Marx 270]|uniref:Uncharacterized protein n=1 Tax=Pisolithus tinctorius Marx 270 TaxID=870435 RepID=A0A0C3NTN1_PISTI|nr:hypothetical protein M404DRAFT_850438 [Pisolithus tinctorius Marx 270]
MAQLQCNLIATILLPIPTCSHTASELHKSPHSTHLSHQPPRAALPPSVSPSIPSTTTSSLWLLEIVPRPGTLRKVTIQIFTGL